MKPPTFDDVRRVMAARSVRDAALYEQVYLALLVAGEHLNPDSPLNRYFNLLPHPAMDDALVIRRHKETLDPMLLVEWDDYQKEFLAILHILLKKWGPQAPPIEVAYWAFRTVLSRMHLLPHKGMAPEDVGSSLNYTALTVFDEADRQTRWTKRIKTMLGMALGNINAAQEFYLVPTLVPLIDMTGHLPSSNVQVEVHKRKGLGSCVELQAVRLIEKGEEIGLRYNTSQSPAFLMYRFGFIPQ
ncbi:hypothetical protein AGDE_04153 [Angomonas deanei]|nr:hypothetical protein AGDE_04407 [Angomonas deanei]EPY39775.1 hypothetical protein AGDE_04153 [Angomonas deanei]|eukprot:EPY39521.1 hypothetical protein AGDE_04407 [Angomonas deanei]